MVKHGDMPKEYGTLLPKGLTHDCGCSEKGLD